MSLIKDLKTNVAAARKPPEVTNGYMAVDPVDGIGNLEVSVLEDTPGGSFDTGAVVDDTNVADAGGYPDTEAVPRYVGDDRSVYVETLDTPPRRAVRYWNSLRWTINVGDPQVSTVVTPSGLEGEFITRVILVASVANAVRIGADQNGALAGAFVPTQPMELGTGPVWYCPANPAVACTLDVFYEYTVPESIGRTKAKDCGCK